MRQRRTIGTAMAMTILTVMIVVVIGIVAGMVLIEWDRAT